MFNLSATIIGGGVLSLPLAFAKCGLVLGTILMIVAGVVTERSLYLLCLSARLTGARSYGEVGKMAFGTQSMESFISLLLCLFLLFVLVAYMVLVRDIWTSILEMILWFRRHPNAESPSTTKELAGQQQQHVAYSDWVLAIILLLISPFLFQRTLHALRFNCYVGFASVSILCFALCHHALVTPLPRPLLMWTSSLDDVLFAFPIITLSFLSIFNVLPVQGALIKPSRTRMLWVIEGAVGSCFVVMLLFGMGGYLYAGAQTDGNILNNCNVRGHGDVDWMLFLGRVGCGITIMLATPMMLLPCRESLLEVLDVCINGAETSLEESPGRSKTDEESRLLPGDKGNSSTLRNNAVLQSVATIAIATTCYIVAIRVLGVAVVWSLCGSFLAFLIAFILPAACYLKIVQQQRQDQEEAAPSFHHCGWICFSWALLVFSVAAAIACTVQTMVRLFW